MKHRIVLYDADPEYSRRIAGFIRETEFRKEVDLTVCTVESTFAECLKREKMDLAVVSAELAEDVRDLLPHDQRVVWLTEGAGGMGPEGVPMLQKYQQVPGLLRQWMRLSGDRGVEANQEASRVPIVAVWSAAGGVGKTKITAGIARTWAGKGLRLFVIGVDPGIYDAAEQYSAHYHDVSEWLYAVKSERGLDRFYDSEQPSEQLHYFSPDSPYEEFTGMARSEAAELLRLASSSFACDAVVVDVGAGWSPFAEEVCRRCHVLIAVCSDEPLAKQKTEKWLQEGDIWIDQGELRNKSIFVLNKCLQEQKEGDFPWVNEAIRLPYVPEWKQDRDQYDPVFQQHFVQLAEEVWGRCREL